MTVGELKEKIKDVSDDRIVAMYVDDDFGDSTLEELDFGYEADHKTRITGEEEIYKYLILTL